ncbi:MAG: STAS domain-containing protein [Leptospiraceae bacterium]|nr:STAS domain-containing protein [Leptospiraceae bacterium]MCP5496569.1 STAS domain-containing protein [Leptospiraceae bacterium]
MSYLLQHSVQNDECLIVLEGEFTIYSASELKEKLFEIFNQNNSILIDLQGVSDFDSSAVQIFALLKREAIRLNKKFKCISHSQAVLAVFDLFGLISILSDKIHVDKEIADKLSFSYGTKKYPSFLKLR